MGGKRAKCWNTVFTFRLCGGVPWTAWPEMKIWPAVGSSNPASIRRGVVFPQPEGPRRDRNSAGWTWSESASTAATSANLFVTSISSTEPSSPCMPAVPPSRRPDRGSLTKRPRSRNQRGSAERGHDATGGDRELDPCVRALSLGAAEEVAVEHDEVGTVPSFDRARVVVAVAVGRPLRERGEGQREGGPLLLEEGRLVPRRWIGAPDRDLHLLEGVRGRHRPVRPEREGGPGGGGRCERGVQ